MTEPLATHPPTAAQHPSRRDRVLRWAGLPISLVALVLVFASVDVSATVDTLRQAAPAPLLLAAALVPCQVTLVTFRWRLLLPRRPDGQQARFLSALHANWLGYLGNLALPARLGEVVRSFVVSRRESLGFAETFGSAVLERIIDASTLAVIAYLTAVAVGAPDWLVQLTLVVAVVGLLAIGLLAVVGPHPFIRPLERLARGKGPGHRLTGVVRVLDRLATGATAVGRRRATVGAIGISVVNWFIEATIFVLVATSLGIELPPSAGLLIAAVTVLGTAIPSAPGYVGTYELAATAAATALGVPEADALALALLAHVVTVLPLAIGGVIALSRWEGGLRPLAEEASEAAEHSLDDELGVGRTATSEP